MHTFVFSEDSKVSLYNVEGDTKMWTPVCIESIDIFSIPGQSQSCLSLVMFTVYCSLATFDLLVAIVAGVQVSLQLPTVGFGVCVCVYMWLYKVRLYSSEHELFIECYTSILKRG